MARIPEATLEAIREATDLVELIGRYVSLRKAGRSHKGLCPFHSEKTPSFSVNGDAGYFYCFGCGAKGNAFNFLIQHDNLTFPEAARALAAQAGIEIPETVEDRASGATERLEAANRIAQEYFVAALRSEAGAGARAYLAKRGFDEDACGQFELGFAPDRWDGLTNELRRRDIAASDGERAGLLKERRGGGHYDLMRGRITFPIRDARGRVVAFGGRALGADQEPKYLNSPETPLFRKREAFYGFPSALEAIRKDGRAVVVEGYFDRLALARAGVASGLATCGTALSEGHARNLRRRTREVTLLFDGDSAGQRAALRSMEVLVPAGLRVRAAALPEGCDPDDYLAANGPEALAKLVNEAPPAMDLAIDRAVANGCVTPWQQADAVASVAPLLALVRDPVERGAYVRKLALATGGDSRDVEHAVRAAARGEAPEQAIAPQLPRMTEPRERCLAEAVRIALRFPEHAEKLRTLFADCTPEAPWPSLLDAALDAGAAGDPLAAIDAVPEALQGLMAHLAEQSKALPADRADRMVADACIWLRRDFAKREARATTTSMRRGDHDPAAFLREKQKQLEARRALTGVPDLPRPEAARAGLSPTESHANAYD